MTEARFASPLYLAAATPFVRFADTSPIKGEDKMQGSLSLPWMGRVGAPKARSGGVRWRAP